MIRIPGAKETADSHFPVRIKKPKRRGMLGCRPNNICGQLEKTFFSDIRIIESAEIRPHRTGAEPGFALTGRQQTEQTESGLILFIRG